MSNMSEAPKILNPLFRPAQYDIISYQRGKLGVAAVPGSGKTFTLAHLAANLVRKLLERDDAEPAEVLIVTFTNVAADSFKRRLSDILRQRRVMLPYVGYRVRTLHGLAHDILQERPALAGLSDDFSIADERTTATLVGDLTRAWWREHGEAFISAWIDADQLARRPALRTEQLPDFAIAIAGTFIRAAKDRQLDPATLRAALESSETELLLARFGVEVYEAYQQALTYRGAVDFDDLARLALGALRSDSGFRKRLQRRWPYILEDEAQDSSQLQQELLKLLSDGKNWVRVGDPNQAINTTFTTANPDFLRDFLTDKQVKVHSLDQAGRSAQPIIDLANELVMWITHKHPVPALHTALLDQSIHATPPGDLQGNPPAAESTLHLHYTPGQTVTTDDELKFVVDSLAHWLPDHPDQTVAVLVPDNARGFRFVEQLRVRRLEYEELLNSTTGTRAAAQLLYDVLGYLAAPVSSRYTGLARLYKDVWWPLHLGRVNDDDSEVTADLRNAAAAFFKAIPNAEAWLWPDPAQESTDFTALTKELPDELTTDLETFRNHLRRWLEAAILPIDQLILTVNQDLFSRPNDIALGYKFAASLRSAARRFPDWRLPEFVDELRKISQNERKFLGFESEDIGYQPLPGQVTVSTYHKAKGLEWDRVYLTGVSTYVFPALQADDTYLDEKKYVRGGLNLKAEALAQLAALNGATYQIGEATGHARVDYAAERLRLLYVGITRARRDLCLTWNTGRYGGNRPALPLIALIERMRAVRADQQAASSQEAKP
ncbi:MAG: ATP-dependent helicase [Aggregatilineales bacterium]